MPGYRFIAFDAGVSPTADEVARFEAFRELLEGAIAYGRRKDGAGLAIGCEAEPFERLRALDPAFDDLLLRWRVRGADVVETLPFAKAPELWKRLRPVPRPPLKPWPPLPEPDDRPAEEKLADATESEGRVKLVVEDAAEQGRRYERLGKWLPYSVGLAIWVAAAAAGGLIGWRLLDSPIESRSETLERIAEDALSERLTGGRRDEVSEN